MNYRYSLVIEWSEENQLYLVTIPEFAELVMQPCTAGNSYEAAVQKAQEAISSYLKYCKYRRNCATAAKSSISSLIAAYSEC